MLLLDDSLLPDGQEHTLFEANDPKADFATNSSNATGIRKGNRWAYSRTEMVLARSTASREMNLPRSSDGINPGLLTVDTTYSASYTPHKSSRSDSPSRNLLRSLSPSTSSPKMGSPHYKPPFSNNNHAMQLDIDYKRRFSDLQSQYDQILLNFKKENDKKSEALHTALVTLGKMQRIEDVRMLHAMSSALSKCLAAADEPTEEFLRHCKYILVALLSD